jgi:RNA polymerase sigma-70 factor (ECF subfamily)
MTRFLVEGSVDAGGFRPSVSCRPSTSRTDPPRELIDPDRKNMPTPDGPRRPDFPSTRWSRILAPDGERDLELLARDYHRPIRAWFAARLRLAEVDAEDLAQEAFTWLLQSRLLDRADPARGRFRAFLKTALANFATDRRRRENADRRGGGRVHEPIDPERDPVDPRGITPDQALDAAWRRELLERARDRLQEELEQAGRRTYFQVFRDYFLAEDDDVDYRALADRHGVSRTDVSNWLDYSKRRYRAILHALVRDTVRDDDELQDELRWLFGPRRESTP